MGMPGASADAHLVLARRADGLGSDETDSRLGLSPMRAVGSQPDDPAAEG